MISFALRWASLLELLYVLDPGPGTRHAAVNNTDQEHCGDHTAGPCTDSSFLVGKPGSQQRDNGGQGQML